jgi:hypothetical protein
MTLGDELHGHHGGGWHHEFGVFARAVLRLLAVLVLALLLWGARFRYDHIIVDGETYMVRVHRVTGHADILIPGEGWVPSEEAWNDSSDEAPQSPS